MAPPRARVATVAILGVVVVTRIAQLAIPGWYAALARDPAAPWWRMFTALFAYDDGWVQFLAIVLGALILGGITERRFGSLLWAAIFVVSGLVGQAFGLVWQPTGAGSSVAVAGLLGAFAAWLAWPVTGVPVPARIGPGAILALGVWLSASRDIHGPPILVGAALGALFLALGRRGSEPHPPRETRP
jgi:rhomboid protease GluP